MKKPSGDRNRDEQTDLQIVQHSTGMNSSIIPNLNSQSQPRTDSTFSTRETNWWGPRIPTK